MHTDLLSQRSARQASSQIYKGVYHKLKEHWKAIVCSAKNGTDLNFMVLKVTVWYSAKSERTAACSEKKKFVGDMCSGACSSNRRSVPVCRTGSH